MPGDLIGGMTIEQMLELERGRRAPGSIPELQGPGTRGAHVRLDGEKSIEEINAEKKLKSRPDLIPAIALMDIGQAMAYGRNKHGNCTWRIEGTEQADHRTHIASAMRHIIDFLADPEAVEEGSGLSVLAHAGAQIAIAIECWEVARK